MRRFLKPALTRPADFEVFWQGTLDSLTEVRPCVERRRVDTVDEDRLCLEDIAFSSLGGARIHGYLLTDPNADERPLVVHAHGYAPHCRSEVQWQWARAGLNVLGIDVRGFGRSARALPDPSRWGYVLTGIRTPETSVLRGAVCDYVRAVTIARNLVEQRDCRLLLHGASFAGGLALMAESLLGVADLLVAAVPTFGWAEGRNFFARSGSGAEISRYLDQRPENAEDVMLVLRYFDPMNFAGRVRCPTLVGVGLSDEVVPAKTVYAIANHLGAPHELMEFPVSHSNLPEKRLWEHFERRWLDLAMNGVPESFGDSTLASEA